MAKANPLKKITAEAKRIRKKQPGKSWKSAVKEAGKKYRAGTIRTAKPKRRKAGKVGAKRAKRSVRKKATKRKSTRRKKPVTTVVIRKSTATVRARRVGRSAPVKRHRMAGSGNGGGGLKKFLPIVLLGAAAFIIWQALKPKKAVLPPGAPPVYQSANPVRNDQANQIIQYALAAGLAVNAITKLIESLNQRDDSQVSDIYDELDRGGGLPADLYA